MPFQNIRTLLLCWLLAAAVLLPQTGCSGPETTVTAKEPKAKPYLVKAEKLGEFTPDEISGRFSALPQTRLLTKHTVKAYRLVYRTTNTDGREIEASGALLVPVSDKALPLLSQQHGTIEHDRSAPSNYNKGTEAWSFGTVLASAGYVVSAPDYIGYGASKSVPHPYQHAGSLASASADMLLAAKEFLKKEKVALNGQLFLAGYSEGGFATMALHRKLETDLASEFTVTASAPGAGAYHTSRFAQYVLGSEKPLTFINTYLWVLETYNRVYKLNKPLSYFFMEPYATQLKGGQRGVSTSVSPVKLFAPGFRAAVNKGTDKGFLNALKDNDVYDWKPKAPVLLIHGTADDYVPFFNSEDAYNAMKANGATQVELQPVEGGDHFSSVGPYSVGMFLFFERFRPQPDAQ